MSSLLWILYSRWQPRSQVLSRQSKMQILRALQCVLCCQYSQRSPGYWSESGYMLDRCGQANSILVKFWEYSPPPVWPGFESWHRCHSGLSLSLVLSLVPRFSPGTLVFRPKNQHFQISNIQSGRHRHVSTSSWELLSAPWVNKLQHYVWMWKLLSPERQSCGFKYIRICVEQGIRTFTKGQSWLAGWILSLWKRKEWGRCITL